MSVFRSIATLVGRVYLVFSMMILGLPLPGFSAPVGGEVVGGNAEISQSGNVTAINQNTQNAIINWSGFDVSKNEAVHFNQPSTSSAVLNRVQSGMASVINGEIQANGRVFIINNSGIIFGQDSRVNASSFMATTLDTDNYDFMHERYVFNGSSTGKIINNGLIQAATGGFVGLLGNTVENNGLIIANLGSVVLASGTHATLDFNGDGLVQFLVDGEVMESDGANSAVLNSGTIEANDGIVLLMAKTARNVFDYAVNNSGTIIANHATAEGGVIHLVAEDDHSTVINSGSLIAQGQETVGGTVEILGNKVGLFGNGLIDVSGARGGGTVLVGGDKQGKGNTFTADYAYMSPKSTILANALDQGSGGKVILWSNIATQFYGSIEARAGPHGGNGGFVETSGEELNAWGFVNTSAPQGKVGLWLLDPSYNVTIDGTNTPSITFPFTATGASTIGIAILNSTLAGASITISAPTLDGGNAGNIIINADINPIYTVAGSILTLTAGGTIEINANISNTNKDLSLVFTSGSTISGNGTINVGGIVSMAANSGASNITLGGNLTANGGISLTGAAISTAAMTTAASGDMNISSTTFANSGAINSGGIRDVRLF